MTKKEGQPQSQPGRSTPTRSLFDFFLLLLRGVAFLPLLWVGLRSSSLLLGGAAWFFPLGGVAVQNHKERRMFISKVKRKLKKMKKIEENEENEENDDKHARPSRSTCGSRCKIKTGKMPVTQDAVDVRRLPINSSWDALPNNDAANARAAHASKEHHLMRHPCSALFLRMMGSPRAQAFAIVSATSPTTTTNLAVCPAPSQGKVVPSCVWLPTTPSATLTADAAALSTANPRLSRTPACAHDAR